jgi:hypothetical protein
MVGSPRRFQIRGICPAMHRRGPEAGDILTFFKIFIVPGANFTVLAGLYRGEEFKITNPTARQEKEIKMNLRNFSRRSYFCFATQTQRS